MITQALVKKTVVLLSSFYLLTGCTKDDDGGCGTTTNTITDVVVRTDDFSTLEAAVLKASLQNTLSGTGPFTVFAPDNNSVTASGITSAALNALTPAQTQTILLYHTLPAAVASSAVSAGPNPKVITASGDSVFVTRNGNGVFVNVG